MSDLIPSFSPTAKLYTITISDVTAFISEVDTALEMASGKRLVCCIPEGRRALTQAVCFFGCYMVLKLEMGVSEVARVFSWAMADLVTTRDPSWSDPDFVLTVADYWEALTQAQSIGWLAMPTKADLSTRGALDMRQYEIYGHPSRGHLHEVVPGDLVAFGSHRSSSDTPAGSGKTGNNFLQAGSFLHDSILAHLGVSNVVHIAQQRSDASRGSNHHPSSDQSKLFRSHELASGHAFAPDKGLVRAFMHIVDSAPGLVAVECDADADSSLHGITLIALYLLRKYDFSARSAISWLRLVRPGSVRGEQPVYLRAFEVSFAAVKAAEAPRSPTELVDAGHSPSLWLEPVRLAGAGGDEVSAVSGRRRSPSLSTIEEEQNGLEDRGL